jgi:hypothetical protein
VVKGKQCLVWSCTAWSSLQASELDQIYLPMLITPHHVEEEMWITKDKVIHSPGEVEGMIILGSTSTMVWGGSEDKLYATILLQSMYA